jgi:hypothetical protein
MKQQCKALGALGLALMIAAGAYAQDKPSVVMADEVETVAKVEGVNYQARTVTLRGPEGNVVTIKVPDAAQNLDQVQAGDNVQIRYLESTAIFVTAGGGEPPSAGQADAVQLAPKGAPAAGVMAQVTQITATVEAINYQQRWVHLRGPQGRLVKVNVPESVVRFPEVRVGDQVVVRHTEAIAMTLQKR